MREIRRAGHDPPTLCTKGVAIAGLAEMCGGGVGPGNADIWTLRKHRTVGIAPLNPPYSDAGHRVASWFNHLKVQKVREKYL